MKLVVSKFNDNMFELNNLFNCSYNVFILSWKSVIFVFIIITLTSSAKRIGTGILFKIVGK